VVKKKITDFICRITIVHGSAYEENKQEFISELHELFLHWDGTALFRGYFNLIISSLDKSNDNIDYI
jgi:hypothetical protein